MHVTNPYYCHSTVRTGKNFNLCRIWPKAERVFEILAKNLKRAKKPPLEHKQKKRA